MSIKLLDQADTKQLIASIAGRAASVQTDIHQAACSCLDHVRAHGDTTGAVALMNALPRGQRVKSLGFWFKHFSSSKLVMNLDKASGMWNASLSKTRQKDGSDFNIEAAVGTTYADLTTERDPVSVTVESMLRNLKRNATNAELHDNGEPKVTPEAREAASKLYQAAIDLGLTAAA